LVGILRYRVEARIYARYILRNLPNARIAVLYQDDDFGKDYLLGLREGIAQRSLHVENALIIAAYPVEHRAGAFKVAAQRYRRAAWDFGCTEEDSNGSVDAVMRTLRVQVEKHVIVQEKLTSLLHRLTSPRLIEEINIHSDPNEFEFEASKAPKVAGPNARAILPTPAVSHRKGQ
jgi:hypothetical protein